MRILGMAVKGGLQTAAGAVKGRPLLPGEWLIEKEAEAQKQKQCSWHLAEEKGAYHFCSTVFSNLTFVT
jgi:hypothetical protein